MQVRKRSVCIKTTILGPIQSKENNYLEDHVLLLLKNTSQSILPSIMFKHVELGINEPDDGIKAFVFANAANK